MKVRMFLLTLILLIYSNESILATSQVPDKLIYQNDTLSIFTNPLEQFEEIEVIRTKLFEDNKEHWNTGCWRGYMAEWTIIDNILYLTAIYSCNYYDDKIKSNLLRLFGEKYSDGKVKADWVTSKILSPQGKMLYYIHSEYESLYEKEVEFEIVEGILVNVTTYDNSRSQKSIYSQDSTLLKFIYSNIQWEKLPKQDKLARVLVAFSGNEQGIIDSVRILRGFNDVYDNEAIRVVQSIPIWDVFYRREQFERRFWNLPVVFSDENRQKYQQE